MVARVIMGWAVCYGAVIGVGVVAAVEVRVPPGADDLWASGVRAVGRMWQRRIYQRQGARTIAITHDTIAWHATKTIGKSNCGCDVRSGSMRVRL